jgi:AraC-like DNA-binding protein
MRAIADNTKTNILNEQFIPDNVFLYVKKGGISFYDGTKTYKLRAGECGIARKNSLVKFIVAESEERFEPFLQQFQKKHETGTVVFETKDALIKIDNKALIEDFIISLKPYYKGVMALDEAFEDLKYEELLIILLKIQPSLPGLFFDFGRPEKINLEKFMNVNYKFNVHVDRFAYLTGRSLSAFKRDFKMIFDETPKRWLLQKRLQEAYFLIEKKHKKPSNIYLDLGFEDLSHFSSAFKNLFGMRPSELAKQSKNVINNLS